MRYQFNYLTSDKTPSSTTLTGELFNLFYTPAQGRACFVVTQGNDKQLYDAASGVLLSGSFAKWSEWHRLPPMRSTATKQAIYQTWLNSLIGTNTTKALSHLADLPVINRAPYSQPEPDFTYHKQDGLCIILPAALSPSEITLDAWRKIEAHYPGCEVPNDYRFVSIKRELQAAGYSIAHKHLPKSKKPGQWTPEDEVVLAALEAMGSDSEREAA